MTRPTTERLAEAMSAAGCPDRLVSNARAGQYDDYKSPLPFPIHQLVSDLREAGQHELAQRAIDGEFDATREEADAWAQSPDGQQAFRELFGGGRSAP